MHYTGALLHVQHDTTNPEAVQRICFQLFYGCHGIFHRIFCILLPDPPYNTKHVSWILDTSCGYKMGFSVLVISAWVEQVEEKAHR